MKTIDYYENLPYRMEITPDIYEGGYIASFPELRGCITTSDSLHDVINNAQEAKRAWLEAAIQSKVKIPEPSEIDNYSGQLRLRVPKSLHKALSETAKDEGISMNQYCVYLLSMRNNA